MDIVLEIGGSTYTRFVVGLVTTIITLTTFPATPTDSVASAQMKTTVMIGMARTNANDGDDFGDCDCDSDNDDNANDEDGDDGGNADAFGVVML